MSTTAVLKWVFIVVILVITMGAGLAPMKIKGCHSNQKILGIANSFSGGVFLAIAFVHILPETCNLYYYDKLEKILQNHNEAYAEPNDALESRVLNVEEP